MEAATVSALRRVGWSLEQIVVEARTSPGDVAVALGADPAAVGSWTLATLVRAVSWVEQRRAGQLVSQIAARAGVSHQRVSKLTVPFGPFSLPQSPVIEWVSARRAGQRLADIAGEYRVPVARVSRVTAGHGPFPYPSRRPSELSTFGIARRFGVAEPTARRWQSRVDFPPPCPGADSARWDAAAVAAWAEEHLTACPVCGARVLNLPRHPRSPAALTRQAARESHAVLSRVLRRCPGRS